MKWLEIEIKSMRNEVDMFANILLDLASQGVSIYDPEEFKEYINNSPAFEYKDENTFKSLKKEFTVKGYFKVSVDKKELIKNIIDKIDLEYKEEYEINTKLYDDNEWQENWKKQFKSFDLTDSIIIKPKWEELETKKQVLEIEPGLAFGTGTHETTKMCANILEDKIQENQCILDIGCGTGILTMVGMLKGASYATAIDVDPIACKTCKEVLLANNIENVDVICDVVENLDDSKYNIICANIIADVVIDIVGEIKKRLAKNGIVIISGVIDSRIDEVKECYLKNGYILEEKNIENSWGAFCFRI